MLWPHAGLRRTQNVELQQHLAAARRDSPESETWLGLLEAALAESEDEPGWGASVPTPATDRPAKAPLLAHTEIALDERAAVANNYKADLFVSIHANASRSLGAKGSEVYFLTYQATDDESRRMAALEGGAFTPGTPAPASGDLALILWDMAQAEHLEESSALASRIQEELADVTGSQGRGVKQAGFMVLATSYMPAILVETGYGSNDAEARYLVSDAGQRRLLKGTRWLLLKNPENLDPQRDEQQPGDADDEPKDRPDRKLRQTPHRYPPPVAAPLDRSPLSYSRDDANRERLNEA